MEYRHVMACAMVVLALAGCTASGSHGESTEANGAKVVVDEARFAKVAAGEDWNDLATRVTGCVETEDIEAFAIHLRDSNPIVASVGLGAGQTVAFDADRADVDGCVVISSAATATSDDPEESTSEASTTDNQHAPDVEANDSESSGQAAPDPVTSGPADPIPAPGTDFTVAFEEDFALESSLDRFEWQIHHAIPFNGTPSTWQGDHNLDCGPPGTTRTIHSPLTERLIGVPPITFDVGEAAYWCDPAPGKEHLMTSFNTKGYAHIDFAPAQTFTSVSRVCWDQNMNNLGRKWTQVAIVDEETYQTNNQRLDYVQPSIEDGPGARGVFLTDNDFLFTLREGATTVEVGRNGRDHDFRTFTILDKARRFTTCLEDLENGTIRIELERESTTEIRIMTGAMPEGPVRVIFQDATYNATKNKSPNNNPFTWHWDNISIETR